MKFAIADVLFWEGLGYDTTHWRKSADGNQAIIDLAYAEILGQNLNQNPAVTIYNADSAILEEILLSPAWANAALNGTYDSYGVLDQVAQFETDINSRVAEILAGIIAQSSALFYVTLTQAEYDVLEAAGTTDPDTFYEITDQEDAVYDDLGALLTSVTTATNDMVTLHDTVSGKLLAGDFDGPTGPQGNQGVQGIPGPVADADRLFPSPVSIPTLVGADGYVVAYDEINNVFFLKKDDGGGGVTFDTTIIGGFTLLDSLYQTTGITIPT